MATISESREEVLAAVEVLRSEIDEDALEHHGIKGMKWGVRNSETLRKYGLLKGASAGKAAVGRAANAIAKSVRQSGANVRKASAATVKSVKAKAASVKQQKMNELAEKKHQYDVDKARSKELGMSKREFDKLRDKTLKSHNPSVVAKGMHTLTDAELKAKIQRMETEGRISTMANNRRKDRAATLSAEFEMIKKSPVYDILQPSLKEGAKKLVVGSLVDKGLKPVLDQRISTKVHKVKNDYDIKNKQGNAYKKYLEEQNAKAARESERKQAENAAKEERKTQRSKERTEKAVNDYQRYLEKSKAKSAAKEEKMAQKNARDLIKQRERERKVHEASRKLNADINRFNRENARFERVLNEGRIRNAQKDLDSQARDLIDRFKAA